MTRPADETIAIRRCDSAGRATQGRVLNSGHSTSARRLAWSGGKSVSLVTELSSHQLVAIARYVPEELITCFRPINLKMAWMLCRGASKPRWPHLPAPRAAGACAPGHGCRAARSKAVWRVRLRAGCL